MIYIKSTLVGIVTLFVATVVYIAYQVTRRTGGVRDWFLLRISPRQSLKFLRLELPGSQHTDKKIKGIAVGSKRRQSIDCCR